MILKKTTEPVSQDFARAAQLQAFYDLNYPLRLSGITKT
jgi:hypothetical protein